MAEVKILSMNLVFHLKFFIRSLISLVQVTVSQEICVWCVHVVYISPYLRIRFRSPCGPSKGRFREDGAADDDEDLLLW